MRSKGQLDGTFAIAARHGVGLDICLHEPGEIGLFNVRENCARTGALGLGEGPGSATVFTRRTLHPLDGTQPAREIFGSALEQ